VNLSDLARPHVWVPGLVLGISLALVIRPLLVGMCLMPAKLHRNEQAFVLFAGLKGAVPILLGSLLLAANVPGAHRLYGIVIVVVAFSGPGPGQSRADGCPSPAPSYAHRGTPALVAGGSAG